MGDAVGSAMLGWLDSLVRLEFFIFFFLVTGLGFSFITRFEVWDKFLDGYR